MRFDYTAEGWQTSRTPDKAGGGPDLGKQQLSSYYVDGMVKEEHIATDENNSSVNTYSYDANNNSSSRGRERDRRHWRDPCGSVRCL